MENMLNYIKKKPGQLTLLLSNKNSMEIKQGAGGNSLSRAGLSRELEVQSGGRMLLENCREGPSEVSYQAQRFAACAWALGAAHKACRCYLGTTQREETKSLDVPLKCFVLKMRCF